MATKKAAGSAKNLTDSKPKYLGVKLYAGEQAHKGNIIIRQRGTRFIAGKNVDMGTDHTLYAIKEGTVSFNDKRKTRYDGSVVKRKVVNVM
jgi:large subunit ribosomal protein L27